MNEIVDAVGALNASVAALAEAANQSLESTAADLAAMNDRIAPLSVSARLGSSTADPILLVNNGQSNALSSGDGQDTFIDQSGAGIWIYSSLQGGSGGTMVRAEYGVAPLNFRKDGTTSSVASECKAQAMIHAANALRASGRYPSDRPIWVGVNAVGGLNISNWIDAPYTRMVANDNMIATMSTIAGKQLTLHNYNWQQGEANGTTAPPYNTDGTYAGALETLLEMLKAKPYWDVHSTTMTVCEMLSVGAFVTTDTSAYQEVSNARQQVLRKFANPLIHPEVGLVSSYGLERAGTESGDNNHFSGMGLQILGERAWAVMDSMRTGTYTGAHILPDGTPVLNFPQTTFANNPAIYLGMGDLDHGILFMRGYNSTIYLPNVQPGQNAMIELEVTSDTGGPTVINVRPGKDIADLSGNIVESLSLSKGYYTLKFNGRWYARGITNGSYLRLTGSILQDTVKGLTKAEGRSATYGVFGNCKVGLPYPEVGADLTLVLRSKTSVVLGAGSWPSTIGRACYSAAVALGGTGYVVGDTIACALGSASGVAPTVTVTAVSAGGVITATELTEPGCITSTSTPTSPAPQASTTGSGTGATFTLVYSTAMILGPGVDDSAASYALTDVNQIVKLEAAGTNWRVVSDNSKLPIIQPSLVTTATDVSMPLGAVTIGGNPLGSQFANVADDTVMTFTLPNSRKSGFATIQCNSTSAGPLNTRACLIYFNAGSSLSIEKNTGFSSIGSLIDVVTTNVIGTSGTDGRITVAVQAGALKIENRLGGSANFSINLM